MLSIKPTSSAALINAAGFPKGYDATRLGLPALINSYEGVGLAHDFSPLELNFENY
jgi:hypothetical protein